MLFMSEIAHGQVCVESSMPTGSLIYSTESAYELRWDVGEPFGYMALQDGDTACVTFPAIPGGKLDSIRVGLRRAGSISGGVWSLRGTGSPLGAPLAVPISANSTSEPPVPYPVPFPNWATIDLSSQSVSTNSAFAVAFVCLGDPLTQQRLMIAIRPDTPAHNYSYLHAPGPGKSPGWFIIPIRDSSDTTCAYLVRAYVSTLTAVANDRNGLTPQEFALNQNYPNPFNPSTNIGYTIASSKEQVAGSTKQVGMERVRLAVYDLLGREVVVLVDGTEQAGSHTVRFDAANLSSGVYLYRLEAGGKTLARAMLLMK